MKIEQFNERWRNIEYVVRQLAVAFFESFPEKPYDLKEAPEERQRAQDDKLRGMVGLHNQVYKICEAGGLSIISWPFHYLAWLTKPSELHDWWRNAAYYESVQDPTLTAEVSDPMPMLRINAPGWFKDPEFLKWINHPGAATWHVPGTEAGEYSDVWFTFCDGEGSDSPSGAGPSIPPRIWDYIEYIVNKDMGGVSHALQHTPNECLVWVSNLD